MTDATSDPVHRGSCLCGAVRYEIRAELRSVTHCHCSMCRKTHGTAYGSYVSVRREQHAFVQGDALLRHYNSSGSVQRSFCSRCSSSLRWHDAAQHPDWVSIPPGTLDTPFTPQKQRHIHVSSKACWHEIQDAWPQSGAQWIP